MTDQGPLPGSTPRTCGRCGHPYVIHGVGKSWRDIVDAWRCPRCRQHEDQERQKEGRGPWGS